MARRTKKPPVHDLSTATARAALKPRSAPYSARLGKGTAVLLYVGVGGQTWKSRTPAVRDADGFLLAGGDKVIGQAAVEEDVTVTPPLPAQTDPGLSFEQARTEVLRRAENERKPPEQVKAEEIAATTFGDVWAAYIRWCESEEKTDQAMALIESYGKQIASIFDLPVATTSVEALTEWRNGLIGTKGNKGRVRTAASVGKTVAAVKAALNHSAIKGPWVDLRKPRAAKVRASRKEAVVLSAEQMRDFIDAATEEDTTFATYCEGLMWTGARPGELSQAVVGDVRQCDLTGATVLLIRYGKNRAKTGDRIVNLPPAGQAFFEGQAEGRDPADLLFQTADGGEWTQDGFKYLVKRAAKAIGVDDATLYSLRHGYITRAIYAGVPLTSLARNCGTSVEMIERTYSHALEKLEQSAFAGLDDAFSHKQRPALKVIK